MFKDLLIFMREAGNQLLAQLHVDALSEQLHPDELASDNYQVRIVCDRGKDGTLVRSRSGVGNQALGVICYD